MLVHQRVYHCFPIGFPSPSSRPNWHRVSLVWRSARSPHPSMDRLRADPSAGRLRRPCGPTSWRPPGEEAAAGSPGPLWGQAIGGLSVVWCLFRIMWCNALWNDGVWYTSWILYHVDNAIFDSLRYIFTLRRCFLKWLRRAISKWLSPASLAGNYLDLLQFSQMLNCPLGKSIITLQRILLSSHISQFARLTQVKRKKT